MGPTHVPFWRINFRKMKNKLRSILQSILLPAFAVVLLGSCNGGFDLPPTTEQNMIATAAENPELSTFLFALDRAGLTNALSTEGPFTVFAPSNDAFNASQMNFNLMTTDSLQDILVYHVLSGRYLTSLLERDSIPTFSPNNYLFFRGKNNRISINENTRITTANIEGTNGVLHIVDRVLIAEQN